MKNYIQNFYSNIIRLTSNNYRKIERRITKIKMI